MKSSSFSHADLFTFVDLAGKSTWAAGKSANRTSQRPDFIEYTFTQGEWMYLDSFAGYFRTAGQEVVRYCSEIVWANAYTGGMLEGSEDLTQATFFFLQKALSQDEENFQSLRGPHEYSQGDWKYTYQQTGDLTDFYGLEEIYFQERKVFFHRAIGGLIIHAAK